MTFKALAAAKVNLFLHVGPRSEDGYHPICSLMVFADLGDRLRLSPSDRPRFEITGPFAPGLDPGGANLVTAARDRLLAELDRPPAFTLTLEKHIPIAAGLGGGSADAAATLVLLARCLRAWGADAPSAGRIELTARALGADVLACLRSLPVLAEGRGDRLAPSPSMPPLPVVLVNPGVSCPTAQVYAAYDESVTGRGADRPRLPASFRSAEETAAFLNDCRNDLEAPALALQPSIGAVLSTLAAQPESLLARLSGSGATCFALCATDGEARRMSERLASAQPGWWVRACRLAPTAAPGNTTS